MTCNMYVCMNGVYKVDYIGTAAPKHIYSWRRIVEID